MRRFYLKRNLKIERRLDYGCTPKGNDFYKRRAKDGREAKFKPEELFAAMAMEKICTAPEFGSPESMAKYALKCADALISELNKEK